MQQRPSIKPLLVACLVLLASCSRMDTASAPSISLHTTRLGSFPLESPRPWPTLRWPAAFLVQRQDRFLWAEGNVIFSIGGTAADLTIAALEEPRLTAGLDRIVAAAQAVDGALAVVDSSGRVVGARAGSEETWGFETPFRNPGLRVALADRLVYFLLTSDSPGGAAVSAYSVEGIEVGRWGTIPAAGIIQQSLNGGGIAACGDGSVYYSYINSPWILRLEPESKGEARALGKASAVPFERIPARTIRKAHLESRRSHTIAPLVELGLSGSRILALFCTEEDLLVRQVAHPGGGGSAVEFWDPRSGQRAGSVDAEAGLLLAVRHQTLYLGVVPENGPFTLERIHYRVVADRRGSSPP